MRRSAGIVVTYTAALDRMIECAKLLEDSSTEALLRSRRAKNLAGLSTLLAPSKEYFVRSKDADGTLHGAWQPRRNCAGIDVSATSVSNHCLALLSTWLPVAMHVLWAEQVC